MFLKTNHNNAFMAIYRPAVNDMKKLAEQGTHRQVCEFLQKHGHDTRAVSVLVEHMKEPRQREARAWELEPDNLVFSLRSYFCVILRAKKGNLLGYFGVPQENPFFGENSDVYSFFRAESRYVDGVAVFKGEELSSPLILGGYFYFAFDYAHLHDFVPKEHALEHEELSHDSTKVRPRNLIAAVKEAFEPVVANNPRMEEKLANLPALPLFEPEVLIYRDITVCMAGLREMAERMDRLVGLFRKHPQLHDLKKRYRQEKFGPFASPLEFYRYCTQIDAEISAAMPGIGWGPEADEMYVAMKNAKMSSELGWDYEKSKRELPNIKAEINRLLDTIFPE